LSKKAARLAFRQALSEKIAAGELVVLDALELPEARTRHVEAVYRALGEPAGLLFVVPEVGDDLARAVRNHPAVDAVAARQVGVVSLLRFALVAVTREGMTALEKRVTAPVRRGA
jgi:large subunit ribosomal protein L4